MSIVNYNCFFAWNLWRASSGIAKGWCCCSCLLCENHFQFYSRTHVHLCFESMDKVTPKQIEKWTTWKYEEHIIELLFWKHCPASFGGCDVCIHIYSYLYVQNSEILSDQTPKHLRLRKGLSILLATRCWDG